MNYLKLLTIIAFLSVFSISFAQSNVGHIDFQSVLSQMPEFKEAQAQVQKLEKTYQVELEASQKELQTKLQTYEADVQNQTEVTNAARAKEIQGMQKNIQDYIQMVQQDLQKKNQDMLIPIVEKLRNAISEVAKELGLNYVMDAGSLLHKDGQDLEKEVKIKLGF
tara:strand:+ start:25 stop:519 length:495 start_codon:yes stop_codon:yes gene_type:complete